MPLKNFYTLRPIDFKFGDVIACVVTLHHVGNLEDGTPIFQMYRCAYPDPQTSDEIPQGQAIADNKMEIMETLFPVAAYVIEMAKEEQTIGVIDLWEPDCSHDGDEQK